MKVNQRVLLGLVVSSTLLGCVAEQEKTSGRFVGHKVLAEFTIAPEPDLILLPVKFKEKEYWFLLDTGSTHTSFDISFKQKLGPATKTVEGITAGEPIMAELFDAPEAFLGPFDIRDCGEVSCMDFRGLSMVLGKRVDGIIGMNFLKKYIVQIDFDTETLLFLQSKKGVNSRWGENYVINDDLFGCPQITGRITDGINVSFFIDTGANVTGDLESEIFSDVVKNKGSKTSKTFVQTVTGTQQNREVRIDNLSIGQLEYQAPIFGDGNESRLGLSFLSRHIVTFDFPNSKIYFKKGKEFDKIDETDMSGLHILRTLDKTIVYAVDEDSPAQKAGIKANDIILKFGNKGANEYDIWNIRRILRSGDKRCIMMTTKRGDNVKEISFFLKKKI